MTTEGVKTNQLDGDLSVGRNIINGGDTLTQGNSTVKKDLTVEGWLHANNINAVNKGLFPSLSALNAKYPNPIDGWWAVVGNSVPGDLYAVHDGKWIYTYGKGGDVIVPFKAMPSFTLMKSARYSFDYNKGVDGWTRSYQICLRFRENAVPDDWIVEYYMYNYSHGKTQMKLVETHTIGQCIRPHKDKEDQLVSRGENKYVFYVTPMSLVDLFFHKFVPENLSPKASYTTVAMLQAWSEVIAKNGFAWKYGDSQNPPLSYINSPRVGSRKYSGNFGVRIVSPHGDMIGPMIPFMISLTTTTIDRTLHLNSFSLKANYGGQ